MLLLRILLLPNFIFITVLLFVSVVPVCFRLQSRFAICRLFCIHVFYFSCYFDDDDDDDVMMMMIMMMMLMMMMWMMKVTPFH